MTPPHIKRFAVWNVSIRKF